MNKFIIRLSSGEYLYNIEITSNYLEFKRTIDPAAADHLNEFDSSSPWQKSGFCNCAQ